MPNLCSTAVARTQSTAPGQAAPMGTLPAPAASLQAALRARRGRARLYSFDPG